MSCIKWIRQTRSAARYQIVLLAIPVACGSPTMLCPGNIDLPIQVETRDANTGAPAAQGAKGLITNGDYSAALLPATQSEPLWLAAVGGPGTYNVLIQKTGYKDWTQNGVYVKGSACGVNKTVLLSANLVRVP